MSRHYIAHYRTALLITLSLFMLIVVGSQWTLPSAGANNADFTADRSEGSTTDVISVALNVAKSTGLSDPDEMHIARGIYDEFTPPEVIESVDAGRDVWVVWLNGKFLFNWVDAHNMPVNNLYVYVDAKTGLPFEIRAEQSPIEKFRSKTWSKVSKSDIGKFPVPKVAPGEENGISSPSAPPTPAKP